MQYSPSQVPLEHKVEMQAVADGLLKIYETLSQMRFVDPEAIVRGPHDISDLLETYEKHKLDPVIIYLYSVLPYIDETQTDARDFFHGGTFVDFRKPSHVERGRDPFYASPSPGFDAENGEYMRPWATPLSELGNHGTVLLYDARQHQIWAIDQEGWGSTDPGVLSKDSLKGTSYEIESESEENWGDGNDDDDYEDEEAGSESKSDGSSEFWSDEGPSEHDELDELRQESAEGVNFNEGFEILDDEEVQQAISLGDNSTNSNSFAHIKSRPAPDVLRDIDAWYRDLKHLPGQGEYNGWLDPELLRPLYLRNGWPENFDGDAFEIDYARAYCIKRARYSAEDPLHQIERLESWLLYGENTMERQKLAISTAENVDAEWLARFDLWKFEQLQESNAKELAEWKTELERMEGRCQRDEDLPLWEMEMLRVEMHNAQGMVGVGFMKRPGESEFAHQKAEEARRKLRTRTALVYEKAYAAALADAERLCAGRTFHEATGKHSLGGPTTAEKIQTKQRYIEKAKTEIQKFEAWGAKELPCSATAARLALAKDIESREQGIEQSELEIERLEKWQAEHEVSA